MKRLLLSLFFIVVIFPSYGTEKAPHPLAEARRLAQSGDYSGAIEAFVTVRETKPESISPLDGDQFGAVYAWADDWEGVQEHARWMFKQFPLPQRTENAERTAKGYLTYPKSNNTELAEHALTLTTFAAENAKGQWVNWFYTAHALALYRNGKFEESIVWAKKSRDDKDHKLTSFALPIEAMAEFALGNTAAARTLLIHAQNDFDLLPKVDSEQYVDYWSDILTSKSVLNEARRLVSEEVN